MHLCFPPLHLSFPPLSGVEVEYSRNDDIVQLMTDFETRNHEACAKLTAMGFNGDAFKAFAPTTVQTRQLAATEEGSDERIRRLAVNLTSHGERFIKTGGQPLNSDDFFRACAYKDAGVEHKQRLKELETHKELYEYQKKAVAVLGLGKTVAQMKRSGELEHLIRFGCRLSDANAPFTQVLKLNVANLRSYYVNNLQCLVEDESLRVEEPPATVPEPQVPSLEETLLEEERQNSMRTAVSLVESARPTDRTWLEALLHKTQQQLAQLEGAEETKEEAED